MTESRIDPDAIAVVGGGTMGRGIAVTFARYGYPVTINDVSQSHLETARASIESMTSTLDDAGRLDEKSVTTVRESISYTTDLVEAVEDVGLVVEAATEDMMTKQRIFRDLDTIAPANAILTTNTSGLSITEITSVIDTPERAFGAHWFNPAHIVPLVEVVLGDESDPILARELATFFEDLGKTAIVVESDVPGFIGNRIQMAMCYEAFSLLDRGIASAEDIDRAVKAGFGFRLPAMGIFEKVDQSGIDVQHTIESYLMPELDRGTEPNPVVSRLVEDGHFGMKTGTGVYDWTDVDPSDVEAARDADLLAMLDVYESALSDS